MIDALASENFKKRSRYSGSSHCAIEPKPTLSSEDIRQESCYDSFCSDQHV